MTQCDLEEFVHRKLLLSNFFVIFVLRCENPQQKFFLFKYSWDLRRDPIFPWKYQLCKDCGWMWEYHWVGGLPNLGVEIRSILWEPQLAPGTILSLLFISNSHYYVSTYVTMSPLWMYFVIISCLKVPRLSNRNCTKKMYLLNTKSCTQHVRIHPQSIRRKVHSN